MAWLMTAPMAVVSSACVAPAPRELADRVDHVVAGRIDGRRRPELRGDSPPIPDGVDRDDRAHPGDLGHHDGRQADGAGAVHDERRVARGTKHVEDGAGAGLHAAAQRRGDAQIDVIADDHEVGLVGQGMRREARLPEERPVHR